MAGLALILALSGCSTYRTPGGSSAPWQIESTDANLRDHYEATPSAGFPAHIVAVRIQASGYENPQYAAYGRGQFSVMTTREVESDDDFARIAGLPMVAQIGSLNRLVLPEHLTSIKDLRVPAAQLQADLLLLYTFDTTFRVQGKTMAPLQLITLGFLPDHETFVTTTASAALYDVRTGFIYGLAESTSRKSGLGSVWKTQETLDRLRIETEQAAFSDLVGEFEKLWKGVVETYATRPPPPVAAAETTLGNES